MDKEIMLWWETWAWRCDGRECLVEAAPQQYKHTQTKIQKRECLVAPKNTNKHKQKYKKWFTIDALDVSFAIFKCGQGGSPTIQTYTNKNTIWQHNKSINNIKLYNCSLEHTLFVWAYKLGTAPTADSSFDYISFEHSLTHSLVIPRKAGGGRFC